MTFSGIERYYLSMTDDTSPEETEEITVSSASLCMSPTPGDRTTAPGVPEGGEGAGAGAPLYASTPLAPRTLTNGHDTVDNKPHADVINGNVNVVVSESTYSMDILSGGESDAGDTLRRQNNNNNNNSISSGLTAALRDGTMDAPKRRGADLTYFIAKELLMTERTYKRDLELVTVSWSRRVSGLAQEGSASGSEAALALARACLALEPMALSCGALLAKLEKVLAHTLAPRDHTDTNDNEEPEYKKIADILYEHLSNTYDAYARYTERCGTIVGLVESVRRLSGEAGGMCAAFEAAAVLPLACLLLRPPHRLLHHHTLAHELYAGTGSGAGAQALELSSQSARGAHDQLRHVENHAALCQLQRDIIGYDKLLVPDREFIRMGCVYKHSTRGLQQRMLFLFSDVMLVCSRAGAGQFRAHVALPLHSLALAHHDLPHSFMLEGPEVQLLISASNEQEYCGWTRALDEAVAAAPHTEIDTELTPYEQEIESSTSGPSGTSAGGNVAGGGAGGLSHVCWHRATSLDRDQMHLAMRTQLSGYLLRKFKKSPGWQKLWVVFALFTLFFYKNWNDDTPLASLPLLGYAVGPPDPADGIDKEYVFKLQFKNHVYFFRADSIFTYNRWVEVLRTSMVRYDHS